MSGVIALDAMGGDYGPRIPVEAAVLAAKSGPIVLVGDETKIKAELERLGVVAPKGLEIVHAPESIGMGEKPSQAVRKKRDSSLSVAARLVAEGKADALVSAGNSGAVMAAGLFEIGRLSGVQRPAIGSAFPTRKKSCVILDLGANIEPTPVQLAQFAVMGAAYAKAILHRPDPKVALLTNGSEEVKGNDLTRAAHELLSKAQLNYVGYCEGHDVFDGEIDVIAVDGFCGNVLLKTLEGFVEALKEIIVHEIKSSIAATAGALLMRSMFGTIKRKLDYEEEGGAPLLGLEKNCLIAHGASSVNALKNAIGAARELVDTNLIGAIDEAMRAQAQLGLWPKGRGTDIDPTQRVED